MKDDKIPKSPIARTPEVLKNKIDKVGLLLANKNSTTDEKEIEKLKQKKEQYEQELEILLYPSESVHDDNEDEEKEAKEAAEEEDRDPTLIQKKLKKVEKMISETNKDEDPKTYQKLQNKKQRYQSELGRFHDKLKDQAKANKRVHVVGAKKATSSLVFDMTGRSTTSATTATAKPMPGVSEKIKKPTTKKVKTEAVAAKKIHSIPSGYEPPVYKKNAYESKLLRDALLNSFVFKSIHNNEKVMTQLVQAFQPTKSYQKGEIILKQGNNCTDNIDDADGLKSGDGGQYFYIIRQGSVDYEVNGKYVGSGHVGQSFGELALLYDSPRAATVRASSSSSSSLAGVSTGGGNSVTKLWKVDQTTFRYVLIFRSMAIQKWKTAAKTIMAMNRFMGNIDTTQKCIDHLEKSLRTENRANICESLAELPEDMALPEDDFAPYSAGSEISTSSSNRVGDKSSSSLGSHLSEQFASWSQSSSTLQSLDVSDHELDASERYATFLKEYANERTQKRNAFEDRRISLDDLEQDAILGEGQFGQVWAVHCKDSFADDDEEEEYMSQRQLQSNNNRNMIGEYALKIQSKNDEMREESSIDMIRRECQVLHDLIHPNIVEFVYSFEDEDNIYLVMSVIKGVELWDILHREDPITGDWYSGMSEDHARFYSFVMADTLNFMHKQKICYRDLKPENIMVSSVDGYPIYVDFGFAKYIPDGKTFTFCGTPNYASPELIQSEGHGFAADHWALGVVIYELICGDNPFYYDGISNLELLESITSYDPAPLDDSDAYTSEVQDLINKLLAKDPRKRLGSLKRRGHDIIRHPWFDRIDRQAARKRELKAPALISATSN